MTSYLIHCKPEPYDDQLIEKLRLTEVVKVLREFWRDLGMLKMRKISMGLDEIYNGPRCLVGFLRSLIGEAKPAVRTLSDRATSFQSPAV